MGWFDDTGDSFGDFSGVDWGNDPTNPVDHGGGSDTYDLDYGNEINNYSAPVTERQQADANKAYNNFFRNPDPQANPKHDWEMWKKGQQRTTGLMNDPTAGGFLSGFGDGIKEWYSSQAKWNPKSIGIPLDVNIPIQSIVGQLVHPLYSAGGLMLGAAGALGGTAPDYSVGPGGQPYGYYKGMEGKDPRDYGLERPEELSQQTTNKLGMTTAGTEPTQAPSLFTFGDKAPYDAAFDYLASRGIV